MPPSDLFELMAIRRELNQLRTYRELAGLCEAELLRYYRLLDLEGALLDDLTADDQASCARLG